MNIDYLEAMSLILLTAKLFGYIDCKFIVIILPIIVDVIIRTLEAMMKVGGKRNDRN